MPEGDLYARAASLVELLFELRADRASWEQLMGALGRALSKGALPMLIGRLMPGGPTFLFGHDIEMRQLPSTDLPSGGVHPGTEHLPTGGVYSFGASDLGFERTDLFQNQLRPQGLLAGPGLCLVLGRDGRQITGAVLVLSREPAWVPTEDDRELLRLLAPSLLRSMVLVMRLSERRSGVGALLGIFDSLMLGVVLLDARGDVSFANRSAAALLGTSAGATRPGRGQAAERKRRTAALRALIRSESGAPEGALRYAHPVDGRPLHIISAPLSVPGASERPDARFATALFLGDPGASLPTGSRALGPLYGLTAAEERLALSLASGLTLEASAERLGIRISTARGVLRSVFEKTGTNRQALLVQRLLAVVGQVREAPPRG